jgi:hypothetical protein
MQNVLGEQKVCTQLVSIVESGQAGKTLELVTFELILTGECEIQQIRPARYERLHRQEPQILWCVWKAKCVGWKIELESLAATFQ